ncbi:MAG: hypothetical protein EOO13_02890 [Chitinophagaceae bacterium]|nr:MAG: hypothetical protein EOO13_02890 [Chitinophagaceae bacterium]
MQLRPFIAFLFFFSLLQAPRLYAQDIKRFNVFSFSVNEGLLQTSMNDIAFDRNNFCWLSFPNGIQKFDGKNFTSVPIQPGLPDDKWVFFFRRSDGELLVSHSMGISRYDIGSNRFTQVYSNDINDRKPAQFIGEDDGLIYFLRSDKVVALHPVTFRVVKESFLNFSNYRNKSLPPTGVTISANIFNHRIAFFSDYHLFMWDLRKAAFVFEPAVFPVFPGSYLNLKSGNELFYLGTEWGGCLKLYNFATHTSQVISRGKEPDKIPGRLILHQWGNKFLLSFFNRLFETDSSRSSIRSEMVNYQNKPVAEFSSVARIREDNFGNLYLATVNDGIKKIIKNSYPIKYYGGQSRADNFVIGVFPDKQNNRVIAGTSLNGLCIFDTSQRLVKHIKTLPGKTTAFSPNIIFKDNRGDYILFAWGEHTPWKLSKDLSTFRPLSFAGPVNNQLKETGIAYFSNMVFKNNEYAVCHSQGQLYRTNFKDNSFTKTGISGSNTMSAILYDGHIVTHSNNELMFFDTASFREVRKLPLKNTGDVRCFAKDQEFLFIGSNKGIFKMDRNDRILAHLTKETGLPDDCIYAMEVDKKGFLWCSSNKGIFRLNKDNSVFRLKREDGLQENEFNTNVVFGEAGGELFFGGINGVSSFYPGSLTSFEEKINVLITKIRINDEEAYRDTAVWNINEMTLPYDKNAIAFDFIAMSNNNPGQYIYQYKMERIDKGWIQNDDLQTVRYLLPPGEYIFQVAASRFFNRSATAMREIHIIIRPPFWKTWWFLAGMGLAFFSLMAVLIHQYIRRKFKRKLSRLESEHQVQLERERISRDLHDSIGAYANAVLYNTELLEQEQQETLRVELMKDLKFASKDIITSLRETIWALKKDHYTQQDCLMRIRNFVQPFSRYYPHIQFKVQGEATAEESLHYARALNVVRIVQEAVTNAIKHSRAQHVNILSGQVNKQWRLEVSDDGKGFEAQQMSGTDQGNGLENMKQRAAEASIQLEFRSKPGVGTTIVITV